MNSRDWTVMVYMAADNDLSAFAVKSLVQLSMFGTSDKVHVLAQVDLLGPESTTSRFTMLGPGLWTEEKIPEMNSGAVADFASFVKWGNSEEHRAERYLIVIWAHANGIFDNADNERLTASPVINAPISPPASDDVFTAANAIANPTTLNFASIVPAETAPDTHPGMSRRPVSESGGDITSGDALTTRELGDALASARQILGKKIAIFGVDACLMSMVEVAQQINESSNLMVASQQTIPTTSWPYDKILSKLLAEPTMDERRLSTIIVDEYIKAYQSQTTQQVTLSACDLEKSDELTEAISGLHEALAQLLPIKDLRDALVRARGGTLSFMIQDFVDLHDFCRLLIETLSEARMTSACASSGQACENAKKACRKVMDIIRKDDNSGFVIASGSSSSTGGLLERAKGVSLYFPLIAPIYKNLLFCSKTGWNKFLRNYASALLHEDNAGDLFKLATADSGGGNGNETKSGGTTL